MTKSPSPMAPQLESDLVEDFVRCLASSTAPWNFSNQIREFEYTSGRADVVATTVDGVLVAFEAKLARWRDALQQAYRNRAFAHVSYVVMPPHPAEKSAQYSAEFQKYGVGLCTLHNGGIVVLIAACKDAPVLTWIADKARDQLANNNENSRRSCCRHM